VVGAGVVGGAVVGAGVVGGAVVGAGVVGGVVVGAAVVVIVVGSPQSALQKLLKSSPSGPNLLVGLSSTAPLHGPLQGSSVGEARSRMFSPQSGRQIWVLTMGNMGGISGQNLELRRLVMSLYLCLHTVWHEACLSKPSSFPASWAQK